MAKKVSDVIKQSQVMVDKPVKKETVTFYRPGYSGYTFILDELDETGKRVYTTDRDGNNRVLVRKNFDFHRVPVKDPRTGKTSAHEKLCVFHVEPDMPLRDRILEILNSRSAKVDGVMTAEEYHQNRNPEMFKVASQILDENEQLKAQVEDLNKRLSAYKGK